MVGQQLSQLDLQETAGGARAGRGEALREQGIAEGRAMGAAAVAKLFLPRLLDHGVGGFPSSSAPHPGFSQKETNK